MSTVPAGSGVSVPDTVSSVNKYTDFISLLKAHPAKSDKTITIGDRQVQMGQHRKVTTNLVSNDPQVGGHQMDVKSLKSGVQTSGMVDGTKPKSYELTTRMDDRKLLTARPKQSCMLSSKPILHEAPPTVARARTIQQKSVGAEKHDTPLKKGLSAADLEMLAKRS